MASADGLRFVVPVKTINARPNSRYFGTERGITYYNFTSDQFSGFYGITVPGTLRDSLLILAGLLEQKTHLDPPGDHERHGRVERRRVRPVLPAGVPLQPEIG